MPIQVDVERLRAQVDHLEKLCANIASPEALKQAMIECNKSVGAAVEEGGSGVDVAFGTHMMALEMANAIMDVLNQTKDLRQKVSDIANAVNVHLLTTSQVLLDRAVNGDTELTSDLVM